MENVSKRSKTCLKKEKNPKTNCFQGFGGDNRTRLHCSVDAVKPGVSCCLPFPVSFRLRRWRQQDSIANLPKANRKERSPSSRRTADAHRASAFKWVRACCQQKRKTTPNGVVFFFGGDNRTRTCDLMRVKHAL